MKKKILLTSIFVGFISLCNINKINSDANFVEYIQKMFNIKSDILRVEPKPNEDYIRLDWDFGSSQPYTYKAYKKTNDNDDFQTISMVDLDKKEKVKVLNIYPTGGEGSYYIPEQNTDETDLAGKRLKKSAVLKEWILEYGLNLIDIDMINQNDFEENPEFWLFDSSNRYIYDVIVVGFWNIGNAEQHLSDNAIDAIRKFIQDGRGVLTGHHHIGLWHLDKGMNKLKEEFGLKFIIESGYENTNRFSQDEMSQIDYVSPEPVISNSGTASRLWHGSSEVIANKKGIILNYPHDISQEGRIFNIPYSHNGGEYITGDSWLSYHNSKVHGYNIPGMNIDSLPDGTVGVLNSYLSTYNNTALIQTGHESLDSGNINASEDEKKILVNTIFYLSQLSTNNYLNDMSGQDVDAPENPVISNSIIDVINNKFIFNLEEIDDVGTKYSYYIEATGQNDGEVKTSNIAETEIKSGLKGYSYVVDTNKNTEPDNEVDTTDNTIEFNFNKPTSNKYYLHIKSIDNVGNFSETVHYEIGDTESPELNLTTSNTDITNGEVSVIVNSEDNTKVDYILLPNNQKVYSNNFTYSILEDGEYRFRVYDIFGNFTEKAITINNIDKEKPSVTVDKGNMDWTNEGVQININTRD